MQTEPERLTAVVEGRFGREHKIILIQQPDGHYEEASQVPETLTATVEGRFGKEHQITLVRQPDGRYKELVDTPERANL